jgi:hypothetical protein
MKTILTSAAVLLTLTSAHSQAIVGNDSMASSQADIAMLPDAPGHSASTVDNPLRQR